MASRNISSLLHKVVPDKVLKAYRSVQAEKHFYFEVQVAEHCNLNCAGCTHFSSIAKPGFLDAAQYEKDIARLSELFGADYPFTVRLMGGEPLLYDKLTALFAVTRKTLPKADISVVTNGILLPQQKDEFWQSCRDHKIKIYISQYPVQLNYAAIDEKIAAYGLELTDFRNSGRVIFRHNVMDPAGACDPAKSFQKCGLANSCHNLKNGRLFTCSVAAHIHHFTDAFGIDGMEPTERDSIDIYKAQSKEEIIRFLKQPIPFCRFCNVDAATTVDWKRSEGKIEEWT